MQHEAMATSYAISGDQRERFVQQPKKLLNRNYLILLNGQFISRMGASVASIAMVIWIKEVTGSASLMGLMSMLAGIAGVSFGVIGGTFADRYSRRKIIAYSDGLSGLSILVLAGLFFLIPQQTGILAAALVSVSIFVAIADAFSTPAISAAVPDLVPKAALTRANSISQLALQLSVLLGQGLGGMLYGLVGIAFVALSNGITFLIAAISESVIVIPQSLREIPARWQDQVAAFKKDTLAGFRYVWQGRGLRNLVLASSLMSFFAAPVIVLIPFYVTDFLKLPVDWVGFLAATYGIGTFAGYLSAGLKQFEGKARTRIIVVFMILESVCLGFMGITRAPAIALSLVFLGGALGGFVSVYIVTIIQMTTPSETRGRLFGVLGTIAGSLAPIGMGLGGIVFDWIGQNISLMYLSCGGITTLIIVILTMGRDFRDFIAYESLEQTITMSLFNQQLQTLRQQAKVATK